MTTNGVNGFSQNHVNRSRYFIPNRHQTSARFQVFNFLEQNKCQSTKNALKIELFKKKKLNFIRIFLGFSYIYELIGVLIFISYLMFICRCK